MWVTFGGVEEEKKDANKDEESQRDWLGDAVPIEW